MYCARGPCRGQPTVSGAAARGVWKAPSCSPMQGFHGNPFPGGSAPDRTVDAPQGWVGPWSPLPLPGQHEVGGVFALASGLCPTQEPAPLCKPSCSPTGHPAGRGGPGSVTVFAVGAKTRLSALCWDFAERGPPFLGPPYPEKVLRRPCEPQSLPPLQQNPKRSFPGVWMLLRAQG